MIKQKRLRFDSSLLYTYGGVVGADDHIETTLLGPDVSLNGAGIVLEGSLVRRSRIVNAHGLQVRKSRLETIDAANADLEQSGWNSSEVADSRFTGVHLNSANLGNTIFTECRMNLLQCQQSRLQNIRFEKCDLRGAFFNMSSMSGTVFHGSDLTGADFSGATISGCDLRRAIIEDIRVSPEQMQGVIVTADQALYLARLFGLDVRE